MTSENFKSHIVFEKLEQFKQSILSETYKESIDQENFTFFETAYRFIADRLKLTLHILLQDAELSALSSEIESGTSQINAYSGNKNIGHIQNAVNNLTSAINRVRNFPIILSKGDFDFTKTIAVFQESIENEHKKLQNEISKITSKLNETEKSLNERNLQVTALQQQLTAKETEIQNALSKYTTDFENLKTGNNSTFESEKQKFKNNIELDRKTFKEQFDQSLAENNQTFNEQLKSIEETSNKVIEELKLRLQEANKIVNIVGNVGVTGNYQNIANQNKRSADNFRIIALFFMVVMSGLLIWSIIELSHGEFNLYKSIVRIIAAAVLTYPAVYAARESTKHRKLENHNRKLELELASIGPFIELLPEDKKQTIKEELVKKYFANSATIIDEKEDDDNSYSGLEKILKTILPYIKK